MFSVGKTAQITSEMVRYGIDILGITECRWSGFGRLRTQTRETIIYSDRDDDIHQSGVVIIMSKKAAQWLDSWIATSDRIIKARFYSRFINTLFRFMLLRMRRRMRRWMIFTKNCKRSWTEYRVMTCS